MKLELTDKERREGRIALLVKQGLLPSDAQTVADLSEHASAEACETLARIAGTARDDLYAHVVLEAAMIMHVSLDPKVLMMHLIGRLGDV